MYQALQQTYDELGSANTGRPLTEEMARRLSEGFLQAAKNLSEAAKSSKSKQESETIAKLCGSMISGERLINHIWRNQSTK